MTTFPLELGEGFRLANKGDFQSQKGKSTTQLKNVEKSNCIRICASFGESATIQIPKYQAYTS